MINNPCNMRPVSLLCGVQFTQIRHHLMTWPSGRPDGLDQCLVGVPFAVLGNPNPFEKHPRDLLSAHRIAPSIPHFKGAKL